MKKRMGVLVLAGMLCFTETTKVFAEKLEMNFIPGNEILIQPQYANINLISYSFDIQDGIAYYGAKVISDTGTRIEIYLELQQKLGSDWIKVTSSSLKLK